ncbi:MAG: hypothetical protein FJY97_04340 [candidate division Zixibacteria bacterium]|nr:hypothetical protein [candidate division Zixibacteria bacterium]
MRLLEWLSFKRRRYLTKLNEQVALDYVAPKFENERGIVYCAGGTRYFTCAVLSLYALRKSGCVLPVEFWYLGDDEMTTGMKTLCDKFEIKHVDAFKICRGNGQSPDFLGQGSSRPFEIKPLAILYSEFKEVLYLYADIVPARNPTYLFDDARYKAKGAIFWPDFKHKHKEWLPPRSWKVFGLEYREELDFESDQILVDKEKCFKELNITLWVNINSGFYYNYFYGDKSSFHLVWRKCGREYCMNNAPPGWKWNAILQYDLDNNLLFQHLTNGKEFLEQGDLPPDFINHDMVREGYEVLKNNGL